MAKDAIIINSLEKNIQIHLVYFNTLKKSIGYLISEISFSSFFVKTIFNKKEA